MVEMDCLQPIGNFLVLKLPKNYDPTNCLLLYPSPNLNHLINPRVELLKDKKKLKANI
jgi:hypothetical protein